MSRNSPTCCCDSCRILSDDSHAWVKPYVCSVGARMLAVFDSLLVVVVVVVGIYPCQCFSMANSRVRQICRACFQRHSANLGCCRPAVSLSVTARHVSSSKISPPPLCSAAPCMGSLTCSTSSLSCCSPVAAMSVTQLAHLSMVQSCPGTSLAVVMVCPLHSVLSLVLSVMVTVSRTV
jgi:hypothetical protein